MLEQQHRQQQRRRRRRRRGGSCPLTIPAGQGPFNDNACQAMNAGDFSTYSATLSGTQAPYTTVCYFNFSYKDGSTNGEVVSFNPGCQYDSKRAVIQQQYQAYLADAGGGGVEAHQFEDVPNLGDKAFYYYQGADFCVVESKNVMTIVSGGLCDDPGHYCDATPAAKAGVIAVAGVVVSRL